MKYHERLEQPHTVYRMFDSADQLLYLGCTFKFFDRVGHHLVMQPWYRDITKITLEWYPARDDSDRRRDPAVQQVHTQPRWRRPVY